MKTVWENIKGKPLPDPDIRVRCRPGAADQPTEGTNLARGKGAFDPKTELSRLHGKR
ncbi:MAG: hypothetical protein Ct9H300mP1_16420 [Planctomycetaceae bacterium]|nr:MAG: hypothetical protein Ct9H300mP1_16420 [Planctomycetaceae bacterium]